MTGQGKSGPPLRLRQTENDTAGGGKLTRQGASDDKPPTGFSRRTLGSKELPPALLPLVLVVAFLFSVVAGIGLSVTDQSDLPLGLLPIILPMVGVGWLLWGVPRSRRSLAAHRLSDSNRRFSSVALTSLALPILLTSVSFLAQVAFLVRYEAVKHEADTDVCKALQRLDGATAQPSVIAAIHSAGRTDDDQLGHIVRAADGNEWPGHLSMVSEDYDRVTNTCNGLSLPIPNLG